MSVLHIVVFMNRFLDLRARFDQSSNYRPSGDMLKAEQQHNFQQQVVADPLIHDSHEEDLRE